MSRLMTSESITKLRSDKPALIVAVSLVLLFSLYASCIPIGDAAPTDHVFAIDQVRFILPRIFVVLLWTYVGLVTDEECPLATHYLQFLCGAIPSFLFGLLLFCFSYSNYSSSLNEFVTAGYLSQYKSLHDLRVPYFRGFLSIAMIGLTYGVVAGLFARRFRSLVIAILIGGALCMAQLIIDITALTFRFYGDWTFRLFS